MAFYSVRINGKPIAVGLENEFPIDRLTVYQPADQEGITRYFCGTCSAHVLVHIDESKLPRPGLDHGVLDGSTKGVHGSVVGKSESWRVVGGALRQVDGVLQPTSHIQVASTMDGGFANQLPVVNGVKLKRFSQGKGSEELPMDWKSPLLKEGQPDDELHARCHCGAVSFYISHPQEIASRTSAPYPDIIFPISITRRSILRNVKDDKWWLRSPIKEGGPVRYLAGHCACNYCRMSSGFEVQSWGWVARAHIREEGFSKEEPLTLAHLDLRPKGLKQYVSSPGQYREFCGTCGATAFWWNVGRMDVICVAMGLLNQDQDGARAEHWFDWSKGRVSFSESPTSPFIIQGIIDALPP
ncbi:hypothetical protein FA15DRAFT_667804 [Coprinopsis marcescibilis]|uniref:Uncharacterized protein n=1 Tax=Coprinopsis marcescibilis TaxID=230819 RepID=A0A5C3L026_COPMA|nr:hypothetical protein FA15DRAFT_667804 [Coprinopsis marcescibilis]